MFTSKLIVTFVLATSGLAPVSAAMVDEPTAKVRFDDLDLTTVEGQTRLNNRVENNARMLCRSGDHSINAQEEQQSCISNAVAQARPMVDRAIAAATGSAVR